MDTANVMRTQTGKAGVIAAAIILVTTILTFVFPLDPPEPTQQSAAYWLNHFAGGYLAGWINQYVAMVACTVIFAAAALAIYPRAPMRAIVVWVISLSSFIIFSITKFMSLWTVPLLAKSLAAGNELSEAAAAFLVALNPLVAFGLIPSLDYLGFWFYGLIALIIFRPLFSLSSTAKAAALFWGVFGVGYHVMYVAMYADLLSQAEVADASMALGLFLIIGNLILFFDFRRLAKAVD